MNKSKILLIIVMFVLCLAVGFCAASQGIDWILQLFGGNSNALPKQANYLVIHVDQLEQDHPNMISLWVVFTYFGDPVSIKAKPLYPSDNLQGDLLSGTFALAPDGLPTPEFINLVKTAFDIPVDNYMLIDDDGVRTLYGWANDIPFASLADVEPPSEVSLIESGCQAIIQGKVKSGLSARWNALLPDHIRTNFGLDEFTSRWNSIIEAGSALDCEALTN